MPTRLHRLRRYLPLCFLVLAASVPTLLTAKAALAATDKQGCTVGVAGICAVASPVSNLLPTSPAIATSPPKVPLPKPPLPTSAPTPAGLPPTGSQTPPPCVATLLSMCVPNIGGSSGTPQCVGGGTACVTLPSGPSGCVGSVCTPGGGSGPPPPGGGPGSSDPGSPAGSTTASGAASSSSLSFSASLGGNLAAGGAAVPGSGVGADQLSTLGAVAPPAVPTTGEFGGLGGLHLGALLVWPIFALLDVLAVVALVILARRSWFAAPGD